MSRAKLLCPQFEDHAFCPQFEDHAFCPQGYIEWHEWAEQMAKTHRQRKCDGCGRYAIWEPKSRALAERMTDD